MSATATPASSPGSAGRLRAAEPRSRAEDARALAPPADRGREQPRRSGWRRSCAEVAADLRVHRFEWTVTRGLVRAGEDQAVYGTEDPATLARTLAGLSVEAIFLLKDLAPHLGAAAGAGAPHAVPRASRHRPSSFSAPGRLSTIVITGAAVDLPAELEAVAVRYRLALPGPDDYRRTVLATMQWLEQRRPGAGGGWLGRRGRVRGRPQRHDPQRSAPVARTRGARGRPAVARGRGAAG